VVDRRLQRIIYICFLISGAAGLIYEVVWARQLSLFLGITTYANTAVITAYMAGLAAGSLVIGRLADRHGDSLRLYAWLEVGVGLYAATTPWLLTWIQTAYAGVGGSLGVTGTASHLLRFALALLLLLVPTFLMGGTLPLLVRGLTSSFPDLAGVTGRLYGINTLGAIPGGAHESGCCRCHTGSSASYRTCRNRHRKGRQTPIAWQACPPHSP
jgi:spermidine synthase